MSAVRLALLHLVLGAWLATTAATIGVAVLSFTSIVPEGEPRDVASATPEAFAQAARLNARLFGLSGRAQLVLAGASVALAAWPPRARKEVLVALAVAAFLTAWLSLRVVPRTAAVGRTLVAAQLAREPEPEAALELSRRLHRRYAMMDLVKSLLVIGASTSSLLAAREGR